MPSENEEDERQQRERGVRATEVEHVVEEQRADAERGEERQHHGGDQHDRRDQRAQQQHEDDQHDGQDYRDDHFPVARVGLLHVQAGRRGAADLASMPETALAAARNRAPWRRRPGCPAAR